MLALLLAALTAILGCVAPHGNALSSPGTLGDSAGGGLAAGTTAGFTGTTTGTGNR